MVPKHTRIDVTYNPDDDTYEFAFESDEQPLVASKVQRGEPMSENAKSQEKTR